VTPITTPTGAQTVTYGLDASIARFSVAKYQRMIESGALDKNDKVELLEGYVVLKMPRNPKHDSTIQRVQKRFLRFLPAGWDLRIQSAITLTDSQPEPDFAIVRGDETWYETRHPGPADVGLLVEVADSSLLRDTADKARIYARAGIPCYWVINLVNRVIEVYTQPSGPTAVPSYASHVTFGPTDALPLTLDGTPPVAIPAADLLP
jgi:Uma2 family endonuclease